MKKTFFILFILSVHCLVFSSGVVSEIPLYIDLDRGESIPTNATFWAKRFPVSSKLYDINKVSFMESSFKKTLLDFFDSLKNQDEKALTSLGSKDSEASVKWLMKKFSLPNINFDSIFILDVFCFGKTFKVFYEMEDPRKLGRRLVSCFTFERNGLYDYCRIVKVDDPIDALFSYSLIRYYNSEKYKKDGFNNICQSIGDEPFIVFKDFDLEKLNFCMTEKDVLAFYKSFVSLRSVGDMKIIPDFYSEHSRKKIKDLIDANMYDAGEKYAFRRRENNTMILGVIPISPLFVVVEKINPRGEEIYLKYTFIIKDKNGNMQITNVFFESFIDDLLKKHGITPHL